MNYHDLMSSFFESYYRHRPVNATFIGDHEYDDRLPDYSQNGIADAAGDILTLLSAIDDVDRSELSEVQETDLRLATGYLRTQLWEFSSSHFQAGNPSQYVSEAVFGPLSLFLRDGTAIEDRVDAAFGRFERIPLLLAQAREQIRNPPGYWVEKAIEECLGGIELALNGVPGYLALHGVDHRELIASASRAAQAFEEYRDYLQIEVLPDANDTGYAAGAEGLTTCIQSGHALEMSPDEIVDYARNVLEETRIQLEQEAAELGASHWSAALERLADDHPTAENYTGAFESTWQAARDCALTHELVTWPDYPIRYVERPEWVRSAAPHLYFLFYRAPSAFDLVDSVDYLVEPLPESDPEPVLRANNYGTIKLNHVVHHGGLGHHVQNWHAYRAGAQIGRIAAVDCASRIAMLCGGTMAEGWSCYTTDLMDEIGFCTPLEHLSQTHGRLRMAARAIVDVELHLGRMSIEEAIAFYRDETGMSERGARSEAVKNSMNPGAALMYLVGTDLIHDLRSDLVGERPKLSLREFHDEFLSYGSIPVALIAESMRSKYVWQG